MRKWDGAAETEIGGAPLSFAWSAEGDAIAFTAAVAAARRDLRGRPRRFSSDCGSRTRFHKFSWRHRAAAREGKCRTRLLDARRALLDLDGKSLVAVCDGAILSVRVADGTAKASTKDQGSYESPVISPDGGRIAYLFREKSRRATRFASCGS